MCVCVFVSVLKSNMWMICYGLKSVALVGQRHTAHNRTFYCAHWCCCWCVCWCRATLTVIVAIACHLPLIFLSCLYACVREVDTYVHAIHINIYVFVCAAFLIETRFFIFIRFYHTFVMPSDMFKLWFFLFLASVQLV